MQILFRALILFSKFGQNCKMRNTKNLLIVYRGFGWDHRNEHKMGEMLRSRNLKLGFCCTNFMNYAIQQIQI
jgi:hypothetical protein